MNGCEDLGPHDHPQKMGCSFIAHRVLGWCAGLCSTHTHAQEAAGWRLHAIENHLDEVAS